MLVARALRLSELNLEVPCAATLDNCCVFALHVVRKCTVAWMRVSLGEKNTSIFFLHPSSCASPDWMGSSFQHPCVSLEGGGAEQYLLITDCFVAHNSLSGRRALRLIELKLEVRSAPQLHPADGAGLSDVQHSEGRSRFHVPLHARCLLRYRLTRCFCLFGRDVMHPRAFVDNS